MLNFIKISVPLLCSVCLPSPFSILCLVSLYLSNLSFIHLSGMDDRGCQTAQAIRSYDELCDQTLMENIAEIWLHKSAGSY